MRQFVLKIESLYAVKNLKTKNFEYNTKTPYGENNHTFWTVNPCYVLFHFNIYRKLTYVLLML